MFRSDLSWHAHHFNLLEEFSWRMRSRWCGLHNRQQCGSTITWRQAKDRNRHATKVEAVPGRRCHSCGVKGSLFSLVGRAPPASSLSFLLQLTKVKPTRGGVGFLRPRGLGWQQPPVRGGTLSSFASARSSAAYNDVAVRFEDDIQRGSDAVISRFDGRRAGWCAGAFTRATTLCGQQSVFREKRRRRQQQQHGGLISGTNSRESSSSCHARIGELSSSALLFRGLHQDHGRRAAAKRLCEHWPGRGLFRRRRSCAAPCERRA